MKKESFLVAFEEMIFEFFEDLKLTEYIAHFLRLLPIL